MLPFGRATYLSEMVAWGRGRRHDLGENTDRMAFDLRRFEVPVTLVYSGLGGPAKGVVGRGSRGAGLNSCRRTTSPAVASMPPFQMPACL